MTNNLTAREILERFKYCICRLEGETGWVNKEVKEKEIFDDALAQLELLKLTREEIDRAITLADRNDFISDVILKAREAKWEGKE